MEDDTNQFKCKHCDRTFKFKNNLKRHGYKRHGEVHDVKKGMKCPGCEEAFRYRHELRDHVSDVHDVPIEVEEFHFDTFKDFELWKDDVERKMACSYVRRQYGVIGRTKQIHRYDCHRTGRYSEKPQQRKREMKVVGSKKINASCPSLIEAMLVPDGVQVKFWKSHFGHKNELGHAWLSKEEKRKIAERIKEGATFEQVLDEFRDSFTGDEISRIDLLSRKDLYNIAKCHQIMWKDKVHVTDCSSVKSWIELMKIAEHDSPIIYYKQKGEVDLGSGLDVNDFQLVLMAKYQEEVLKKCGHLKVCIDSTLGTNSYDFQIIILLTIDELGCGCPISYCFTNRTDEIAVEVFFNVIKNTVGMIPTNVFMSHDAPAFYDAWGKVMGHAQCQLLCSWHVDSIWRKNLPKIHGAPEKKTEVYQTLRILLQEPDQEKFELLHSKFVEALCEDEDTKIFGAYFKKFYSDRCKMWALCYRLHLGLTSNEQLAGLHKRFKSCYFEGERINRLDNTLSMLLKIGREECFKKLINIPEIVSSTKLNLTKQNHINSRDITDSMVAATGKNSWAIKCSDDDSASNYDVTKLENAMCINKCRLTCDKCNICIHMYECTCMDNFIRCNICEHIHACASNPALITILENDDGIDAVSDDSATLESIENAIKKKAARLKRELEVKPLSEADRIAINKYLDCCLSVCETAASVSNIPPPVNHTVVTPETPLVNKPTILMISRAPEPQITQKTVVPLEIQAPAPNIGFRPQFRRLAPKTAVVALSQAQPLAPRTTILLVPQAPPPPSVTSAAQPKLIWIPSPPKPSANV